MTWQDLRAADLVRTWNRSCTLKVNKLKPCSNHTLGPLTSQKTWCWDRPFCLLVVTLAGDPRSDEGGLLPDQTEAFPCSQYHRILHSARDLASCLGLNTLRAGRTNSWGSQQLTEVLPSYNLSLVSLIGWRKFRIIHHFNSLSPFFQVRDAVAEGNCCFGTIDTWLIFKLTKGAFGLYRVNVNYVNVLPLFQQLSLNQHCFHGNYIVSLYYFAFITHWNFTIFIFCLCLGQSWLWNREQPRWFFYLFIFY